jgi:hypothetical protein
MFLQMLQHLKNTTNVAYTENGAKVLATTQSALVDWFAVGGALRKRTDGDIISLFTGAYGADKLLAMKSLFYFRDIRGGQGERRTFRVIARYMAENHADSMGKNVHLFPEFGRWDDIYVLRNTPLERIAAQVIRDQWMKDEAALKAGKPVSLQGKWLDSENASSSETIANARWTMKVLGLTPRQYRKGLVARRNAIKIVESALSAKAYEKIDYSKLPSHAAKQYRKAFQTRDTQRYTEYLASLQRGETKVNAGTLAPYELVEKMLYGSLNAHDRVLFNAQWKALPDYYDGVQENSLVIADVSGSMSGRPMAISISLALYVAQRNKGVFHNHFMTFSDRPALVECRGSNLYEIVKNMERADWADSTNLEAALMLILNTAVKNKLTQDEMPKRLYIVSDMQFNSCMSHTDNSFIKEIKGRFNRAGYQMPVVVFWHVDARNNSQNVKYDDRGYVLVSGTNPAIFKTLLKGEFKTPPTPYEIMMACLSSERYAAVTV